MALIWCDGFDHYGAVARMTEGAYGAASQGAAPLTLSATNPRTGSTSLQFNANTQELRFVLPDVRQTVGVGFALFLTSLPVEDGRVRFGFLDAALDLQVQIDVRTTGAFRALRGSVLGESAPVLTAGVWHHVEARVTFDNATGSVEIRVNGVTVLALTGVDTVQTADANCAQVAWFNSGAGVTYRIDDMFIWDDLGASNNDFIGDRRVRTLFPDANTIINDWTPNVGQAFDAINDATPDDDATYIEADVTGETAEFSLQDLPPEVISVVAVMPIARMRKTDAGDCNVQLGMVSGAAEALGADRPITTQYAYWRDILENDPATGAPWTPAAVNAAQLKIKRTL